MMKKTFIFALICGFSSALNAFANDLTNHSTNVEGYFVTTHSGNTEGLVGNNQDKVGIKLICERGFQSEAAFLVNCSSAFDIKLHFSANIPTGDSSVGLGFLFGRSIQDTATVKGITHQNMIVLECKAQHTSHGFPDLDCRSKI